MPLSTEPPSLPPGVGRTALGVARVRAAESRRPDRLFDDPLARAFVAAAPDPVTGREELDGAARDLVRWLAVYTAVRTRFYDDHLTAAVAAGCPQVVLVAAGLDTRAYRLGWPAPVRLFELDLPEVLAFKQAVLDAEGAHPGCERAAVRVDLRADWPAALTGAGLDPGVPTAWLVEGLLVYLTAPEAATLLERLTALSAPGSRLACELPSPRDGGRDGADRPHVGGYTDLWQGGLGTGLVPHLQDLGWQVATHDRADVAAGYGRAAPPSRGSGFVTARRPGT